MLFATRLDSAQHLRPAGDVKRLRQSEGMIDLEVLRLANKIDVDFAR
jgi:hypothetical protein